jgi:hypothetical protein
MVTIIDGIQHILDSVGGQIFEFITDRLTDILRDGQTHGDVTISQLVTSEEGVGEGKSCSSLSVRY